MLIGLRHKRKQDVGCGAPGKDTMLLTRSTPGTHIPICSPADRRDAGPINAPLEAGIYACESWSRLIVPIPLAEIVG
jgi:hypothetical protein